jgi:hypothetical protein
LPLRLPDVLEESLPVRPPLILRLFWMEQIVIEETAEFLEPIYMDAA